MRLLRVILRARNDFWFVLWNGKRNNNKFCRSIPSPEANNCASHMSSVSATEGAKFGVPVRHFLFFFYPKRPGPVDIVGEAGNFVASGPSLWPCSYVWRAQCIRNRFERIPAWTSRTSAVFAEVQWKLYLPKVRMLNCDLFRKNWKSFTFAK